MRAAVISFTQTGNRCNARILSCLKDEGYDADGFSAYRHKENDQYEPVREIQFISLKVSEWTKWAFEQYDALIFVGAAAIAVRSIAPCLKDKFTDPAVLVVDEKGQYIIPLLSGHVGGANRLAGLLADQLQALPVITTATDIQGLFAVDVFAVRNQLILTDRRKAKEISAAILSHKIQQIYIDEGFSLAGTLPNELHRTETIKNADIVIDYHHLPDEMFGLQLIPKQMIWLGIGCKRGTASIKIAAAIEHFLEKNKIDRRSIAGLASIDVKAKEKGILEVAIENHWTFQTFTARQLQDQKGDFTASAFVNSQVGVDNVCERAAVCAASEEGTSASFLLIRKEIAPGITLAAAGTGRRLNFE